MAEVISLPVMVEAGGSRFRIDLHTANRVLCGAVSGALCGFLAHVMGAFFVLHWMRPTHNLLVLRFGVRRLAAAFPAPSPTGSTKAGAISRTPKRLPFLTGGALARTRKAPHELDDARVLPVNGSDDFLGNSPAAVEDVGFREFERTVATRQDLIGISRDGKRQVKSEREFLDRFLVLVHADADHRYACGAHLLRELLETRRLLDAGRAPR